ncbi:MAG: Mu transposase C-terminal domain-containing protein [Waterburya sp.]
MTINPKNLSIWTIGLLYAHLCEWAYDIYDQTEHPSLEGYSPREAFANGIKQYGNRDIRRIPYDENFKLLTLPTTNRGKAKVNTTGVIIDYKHYWHSALRDPEIQGTLVDVRYDPFNAGKAYAYIRGQWLECISEHYVLFQGRSEKEIQLASEELKKRKKAHGSNYKIRAKQLGNFLAKAQTEEIFLKQRLRDEQGKEVFQVIEGGLPNVTPYNFSELTSTEEIESKAKPETLSVVKPQQNVSKKPIQLKKFKGY